MQTWDVWQSPDLGYAFFAHDAKGVQFGLLRDKSFNMAHRDMSSEDIYMNSSRPTEPVLLILLSLVERPRHGYAIFRGIPDAPDSNIRSWNSAAATYQCC